MKTKFNLYGRGRPLRWAITGACQLAFVLFGYDQGVFSGIVGNEHFRSTFGNPSDSLTGIIVSIYNLGCFSGCVLNFFIGDWLGRRKAMWFAMCWIIVGAVLQTSAFSVPHMLVARYITGIGTGIETSTVPMYQAELAEAHRRGRLVCSEPLFVGVGIVISYFFDYGMSFVPSPPGIAWRLPIACQMIFAFVVIGMVFGLPESPRYLCQKHREDEALAILCDVYDRDPSDPKIQREQSEVLEALEVEREHGEYKWRNIMVKDKVQTGRRVLLAYGSNLTSAGINLVVYFVPTALQENVGLTHNLALIIGGCVQCMFVIGSLYPTFFIDRSGRRPPMLWGSIGLGVSMMMIAVLLSVGKQVTSSAAIAFFFTYMLIFGASVNCIPWCYVPEILPLHVRAKGTAVGISSNWIWNFFVVMITPVIINRLQWKAYLIFMCLNFAFVPLVYFCYPETANLTLEEIDFIFADHTKSTIKTSKQMCSERMKYKGARRDSFVAQYTEERRRSKAGSDAAERTVQHTEKSV
ncbi:uncharacterized protein HMPREF1541_10147 [Cyphellophora europaea CBS 101466]|uniref:Major facilitator superfamily (MFS) profile domain-containing protein n=1 Tax=Cyphellophora europaea (strain CBS 101466) TaxID=1220924 RepID=W2S727_CYPE1|nr:uncharacterized protein HMPREF1541_10147 [Cyphellophora europaea CBS 101466]ETN44477.1 hypothetical protein HMPREF1541_10147 [Cyphellophora europaea CBS 101466]